MKAFFDTAAVSGTDPVLSIRNVTKVYKNFSLKNMNIDVPAGSIMGFIGENGAGKSTTIKLIMDLVHEDSGEIMVFGQNHKTLGRREREWIGVVLDECHFPAEMTAGEVGQLMKMMYKTWDKNRFYNFLKVYKLPADRKVKDYSRGMQMKLSLAVAMSHDTRLLILDEATSGLDPIVRDELLDQLMEFIQDENHSVFLSSHILSDLEKICDYITFIHKGQILLSENKDELLERHGILKCSREELECVRREAMVGARLNAFGAEALVLRHRVPETWPLERVSLEQIMLYYTKGDE